MWPGYALLVAAAYAKENFFFVTVLGVAVTVLIHGIRRLNRRDVIVLGVTAALIAVDVIVIVIKTSLHGAVYPDSRTLDTFKAWGNFALSSGDPYEGFTTGAIAACVLLGIYATTRRRLTIALALVATGALLVLPQIAFYAGNPSTGRYLYPLAMAPCLTWGVCLWRARSAAWWPGRLLASAMLVLAIAWPLHNGVPMARTAATTGATANKAFQHHLSQLEASIRKSNPSVVVLQPLDAGSDIEAVESYARYLANAGGFTVMIAPPVNRSPGFDTRLAEVMDAWSRNGQHNIAPYNPPKDCVAVVFGGLIPACLTYFPA